MMITTTKTTLHQQIIIIVFIIEINSKNPSLQYEKTNNNAYSACSLRRRGTGQANHLLDGQP